MIRAIEEVRLRLDLRPCIGHVGQDLGLLRCRYVRLLYGEVLLVVARVVLAETMEVDNGGVNACIDVVRVLEDVIDILYEDMIDVIVVYVVEHWIRTWRHCLTGELCRRYRIGIDCTPQRVLEIYALDLEGRRVRTRAVARKVDRDARLTRYGVVCVCDRARTVRQRIALPCIQEAVLWIVRTIVVVSYLKRRLDRLTTVIVEEACRLQEMYLDIRIRLRDRQVRHRYRHPAPACVVRRRLRLKLDVAGLADRHVTQARRQNGVLGASYVDVGHWILQLDGRHHEPST